MFLLQFFEFCKGLSGGTHNKDSSNLLEFAMYRWEMIEMKDVDMLSVQDGLCPLLRVSCLYTLARGW